MKFSSRFFNLFYLLILAAYILAGTFAVPFHGDEATQIYMSRDYAYQFLQGDLDRVRYHDPPISAQEQELRLLNGTINKYAIGFAWRLSGFRLDQVNEQWDWGADWDYNQANNHAPSEALLNVSRIPSALFLAAGVVVMFAIGHALAGRLVAYLASLFYALDPALLLNGRRAMMEGSMILFSLLVVLAAVGLLQKRRWWTALLLGVSAGLALASKHTALFTVVAVFGACALYPFIQWWISRRSQAQRAAPPQEGAARGVLRIMVLLVAAGVIALGVFYALNPAWWGDPVARARLVLDMRAELLAGQTAAFGGYAGIGDALGGFFRQVFIHRPQYYELPAWAGYITEPIARYEASLWRGSSLGISPGGGVLFLALTLLGGWGLFKSTTSRAARFLIGMWALAAFITTALLTPIEWQRYYLPALPAVDLLAAYGFVWLLNRLQRSNRIR